MRYLFILCLCSSIFVLASCDVAPWSYDIGNGLVLEQTPPEFEIIADNTRCGQLLDAVERGEIPATFETETETVIVQEGFMSVVVTPMTYHKNGSVKREAKARLLRTPEVEARRKFNIKCKPITRRIIVTPATYKIKDESGATIKDFKTAEAVAVYINTK